MLNNKAIELWQETNELLARIAGALEKVVKKPSSVEVRGHVEETRKGCPIAEHSPDCDCEGAGGWR